jgi:DNA-binding FrmR family transcriptional regulator
MKRKTTHKETIPSLRRAAGQVKGVEKMVEEEKYCIDIITQIHAAINALYRVSEDILEKHLKECVTASFKSKSYEDKSKKISEIMKVVKKLHKL